MKTKSYKFIVMLAILLGSASTEIKAQNYSGHPIIPRKANGQDYTKAEIKAKLSQPGVYWDAVRSEIVRLTNKGLEKSGESMRVTAKNIGWIIDSSVYLPKNEYGDQIKNGYTIDYKTIKYVTTRKIEGNYLVFQYRKCSVRILDPACLNPQEEIVTQNISEVPNVQQDFASDYNTQNETKTKVKETETVVEDKPCTELVWKKQRRLITKTHKTGVHYAGIGDFSGSRGNRMPSESVTTEYYDEQWVQVEQPCDLEEVDLPIASDEEYEEAKVATREGRPFYIVLNIGGQFNFSKAGNYSGSGNTGGGTIFTPKTPGGQGGGFTPKTPGGGGGTFTPRTPGRRGG